MELNPAELNQPDRYKILIGAIVPRPIALITTVNAEGVVNAAPFSMFNMLGEDPPIVMVSINRLKDGRLVGDVDFEGVSQVAGWITPVPGGVGPMTVAMLLRNTVRAAKLVYGLEKPLAGH